MASTRRSRSVNKRFAKVNEEWPDKDGANADKNRPRKRKLSDMLGPQWSKEELERFYEAYRKFDKDWRKVAGMIQNRSLEMVEALYNMNKAYLSLPEGTATAAGLIAMMTGHYNIMEGSDSERESNDEPRTSRRPQKRAQGKYRLMSKGSDGPYPDLLQFQSASSSYACMSLLKKQHTGDLFPGSRPRAVGKRTPRIPVSNMYSKDDRDEIGSFGKHAVMSAADEGAHVAALAVVEASQEGGSPQASRTPGRRGGHLRCSPARSGERKDTESEMADSKTIGGFDVDYPEGSLGSREAENGDFTQDVGYLMDTGCARTYETHQKEKKLQGKRSKAAQNENDDFDDDRKACSGTEEGLNIRKIKDDSDMEVTDDENAAFDALQTLADLSFHILLPSSTVESESSVQAKDEKKNVDNDEKPSVPESVSTNHLTYRYKIAERKGRSHQTCPSNNKMQRNRRKPPTGKTLKTEFESTSQKSEPQKMEEATGSSGV